MVLSRYKIKKHEELYSFWNPDASEGPSTLKKSKLEQTSNTPTVDSEEHSSDKDVKYYGHSSSQSENEYNVSILCNEPEDTSASIEVSCYTH